MREPASVPAMAISNWRSVLRQVVDAATSPRPRRAARPARPARPARTPAARRTPGRTSAPIEIDYAPRDDGRPDPGEIVWAWVPFEEGDGRGKDRPVLVVGR